VPSFRYTLFFALVIANPEALACRDLRLGYTPLHFLLCNPRVEVEHVRLVLTLYPEAAFSRTKLQPAFFRMERAMNPETRIDFIARYTKLCANMLPIHLLLRSWPSLTGPDDGKYNEQLQPNMANAEAKARVLLKTRRRNVAKQLLQMLNKANPCALEKQDGLSEELVLASMEGTSILSLNSKKPQLLEEDAQTGGRDDTDIAKMQDKFAVHSPTENMINQYAGSPLHLLCAGPAMRSSSAELLYTLVKMLHGHHDKGHGDFGLHFTSFGMHGADSKADRAKKSSDQKQLLPEKQLKGLDAGLAGWDDELEMAADYSAFQNEAAVGHLFTSPPIHSPLHILCANPFIRPPSLRLLLRAWPAGAKLVRNDAHPLHLLCANPSIGGGGGMELMLEACKIQEWDVKQAHLVRAGSPLMILCHNPRLTKGVLEGLCIRCPWMVLLREQGRDHVGGAGTKGGVSGQTCLHQLCSNHYALRHDLLQVLLQHMRRLLLAGVAQIETRQEDAAHAHPGRSVQSHPESGQFALPMPHSDGSKPSEWFMNPGGSSDGDADPLRWRQVAAAAVVRDDKEDGLEGSPEHHSHHKKLHDHHKGAAKGVGVGGDTIGIGSIEVDSGRTALHLLCSNPRVEDDMISELLQMEKDVQREEARIEVESAINRAIDASRASGSMRIVEGSGIEDGDSEKEEKQVAASAAAEKEEETTSACVRDVYGQLPLHRFCCNEAMMRRAAAPGTWPDLHRIVRMLVIETSCTLKRTAVSWEDNTGRTPLDYFQTTVKKVGKELLAEQERKKELLFLEDAKNSKPGSLAGLAKMVFVSTSAAAIEADSSSDEEEGSSNEHGQGEAAVLRVATSATGAAAATASLANEELSTLNPVSDHCYHHYPADELLAQSELDILILGEETEKADIRGSGFHEDANLAALAAKSRPVMALLKQALKQRRVAQNRLKKTSEAVSTARFQQQ
jgi:hypothetical protein